MSIFSSPEELQKITDLVSKYIRLPFSENTVPGSVLESVFASVRKGVVLNTYDFVDVISSDSKLGWQMKSTKATTPVTWKRAKIPTSNKLIQASYESAEALQILGNAIIEFCNEHARQSLETYGLEAIGFARLIVNNNSTISYYERKLCSRDNPSIFNPDDFIWEWSIPKKTVKKEQLPALHGKHKLTQKKWWAWHGLGENQLHFSGEKVWWPESDNPNCTVFHAPSTDEKMSLDEFVKLLGDID